MTFLKNLCSSFFFVSCLTSFKEYVEEAIEQMDFDKQQEMELFEQDINEYQMWEMEQERERNQQTDVHEDHEMI